MQNRLPLVSVVIPMYKSKPYINACINSVLKINYPCYEILVIVDGDDTDTYYQVVSKFKNKKLKVFLSKKRLWLAGARSLGFKKSKGKYVALLDHDVEVASDWLDEHIAILEEDKSVVATQGKTLDINQRKIIQTTAIRLYKQFMWVKCVGFGEEDKGQYVSKEYSLAGATNVVFRKSVVAKFGFYDEKLRFNIDDLDLAIRLWGSGYKTVTATRSIIYH
ncbi:MAG: glycosyltransferase family 2 protein [Patescibacteria group bacterium]|nr:glycosyltransferase family 2 protein [Patescibacteria group bacterium]